MHGHFNDHTAWISDHHKLIVQHEYFICAIPHPSTLPPRVLKPPSKASNELTSLLFPIWRLVHFLRLSPSRIFFPSQIPTRTAIRQRKSQDRLVRASCGDIMYVFLGQVEDLFFFALIFTFLFSPFLTSTQFRRSSYLCGSAFGHNGPKRKNTTKKKYMRGYL